jgi:glyoxylase-like metal-dependent hydrolase (beta-lactamase superfamily II)/rhodanese-related sulfurtransferase
MYFDQFYLACLAHASYMIGSEGVAAVIDPQRDVEIYIEEAKKQGLQIAHIIETHLHADFVSGHRELAALTGATIHVGEKAGALYPHHDVKDGDEVRFGQVVLHFLETPGHTLESICIVVTDLERSPEPYAVMTGDTLFIGDVGRPDLSPDLTPQQLAGMLYDSLHQKLLRLPDSVEVYPAHGAGSLCGRNISQERSSTIGKERKTNYALKPMSRDEFVQLLTSELPPRPEYFLRDAEINRGGASPIENLAPLKALTPQEVLQIQASGAVVLDTRPATLFGAAHIPGAIHIALTGQFASWAGIVIGLDQPIVIVAEEPQQAEESRIRLSRVGIEKVAGYLEGSELAWDRAGLPHDQVPQISVLDLYQQISEHPDSLQILDVRKKPEWESGHIEGAQLKPLDRLQTMLAGLDPQKPTAVHCKSGYRSSIATSLLQRAGFSNVMNVVGGFDAWLAQKLPTGDPAQPAHTTAG